MQEFIGAFLSAVSYFLTTYFLYRIFGGRRLIPLFVFGFLFMNGLLSVLTAFQSGNGLSAVLFVFMTQLFPVLIAGFFFFSVTGIRPIFRIRLSKKIKELPMDIQTKKQTLYVIYSLMVVAVLIGILGFIFSSGITMILSFALSGILLILDIVIFFQVKHIESESVILLVGKDKERIYEYQILSNQTKVLVSDFYQNPMFIVDKIGEVLLKNDQKSVEKHHLYWIATSSKIDMSQEKVKQLTDLPYRQYLDRFEKYHFKRVQFSIGKTGRVEFINEMILK